MKSFIIFFFLVFIIFVIMGNKKFDCPPPRVEYRYIPKTFEEEQMDKVPILGTYGKLFTHASPWENSLGYPGVFYNKKESF